MIEVQNLSKRYGDTLAIDGVSFSVARGEILAFLGPNGAGKTTTMRILTGLIPPSDGTATVAGYSVLDQPEEVKRRIGYLPDNPPLYTDMTVDEYLTFAARLRGLRGITATSARDAVLEKCALGDVRGRLIGNLSRGYRQRVGLAQAMIHSPEILIMDEPTVGLDPRQIADIRKLIRGLAGEHTVILSTHVLPEATAVCDKVVIIARGKVVAVDSQERLATRLHASNKIALRVRRHDAVDLARLAEINGVLNITPQTPNGAVDAGSFIVESAVGSDVREAIATVVVQQGWGLLELAPQVASLEEVFLQLTTQEQETDAEEAVAA
jgi:ABC-2 type transport system ATP-binding protein